jgi:hypothetical protein
MRVLAKDVTTMVDMPVAMAILTAKGVSKPSVLWNMKVRMGISTNPPPTPSKPAKKPVKMPRMARSNNNQIKMRPI